MSGNDSKPKEARIYLFDKEIENLTPIENSKVFVTDENNSAIYARLLQDYFLAGWRIADDSEPGKTLCKVCDRSAVYGRGTFVDTKDGESPADFYLESYKEKHGDLPPRVVDVLILTIEQYDNVLREAEDKTQEYNNNHSRIEKRAQDKINEFKAGVNAEKKREVEDLGPKPTLEAVLLQRFSKK